MTLTGAPLNCHWRPLWYLCQVMTCDENKKPLWLNNCYTVWQKESLLLIIWIIYLNIVFTWMWKFWHHKDTTFPFTGTHQPSSIDSVSKIHSESMIRKRHESFFNREDLENLSPDFQAIMCAHSSGIIRGVIVTLQGTESNGCVDSCGTMYDFVSRYFAPWLGVPEDPVTGEYKTMIALPQRNLKPGFSLWKRIKCFLSWLHQTPSQPFFMGCHATLRDIPKMAPEETMITPEKLKTAFSELFSVNS